MSDGFLGALIGAIIGAAVSGLVTAFTLRFNYRQLFASTVSGSRMDWINAWRENVAKFIASAKALRCINACKKKKKDECRQIKLLVEYNMSMEMIALRLNMNEEIHCMMFEAMKELDYNISDDIEFNARCEHIEILSREILKPEWERVKDEAKGKRR